MDTKSPNKQPAYANEIKSLQAARAFAVLLVLFCHAAAFIGQDPNLWRRAVIYVWLRGGALGVQVFFVISGIVIFRAHRHDIGHKQHLGSFTWKRIRRIYPVYWICLFLTLLNHQTATGWSEIHMYAPAVVISNVMLVHLFSYQTIMVQAWTLFDEVQFYFVFALWIFDQRLGSLAIGIWLALSLVFMGSSNVYGVVMFSPYHLLFVLGMLVAYGLETETDIAASWFFWLGIVTFCAAVVAEGPLQWGVSLRLVAGLGAASALFGACHMEFERGLKVPSWIVRLGDASYSIYLVHFMVISVMARFAFAHLGNLPVPIAGWLVLLILGGILSGLAVHYVVERPLLRLMGKR